MHAWGAGLSGWCGVAWETCGVGGWCSAVRAVRGGMEKRRSEEEERGGRRLAGFGRGMPYC